MKRKLLIIAAMVAVLLNFSTAVQATGITGSIEFFGAAVASGPSGAGTTTITFPGTWRVLTGIGDYAGVPIGTPSAFHTVKFTGDGLGATLTAPVVPQWNFSFGGVAYSFDLNSLVSGVVVSGSMALSGNGIAHISGLDDTPATWALQGSTASGFKFKLSSSTTSAAAPDGGTTVVLLGFALTGLEGLRRKLKK